MENKNIWLKTSLFSDKDQWAYVLNNGIKAFLNDASVAPLIEAVLTEFNYISGENIRFAINVQSQYTENVSYKMDDFFKSFFLKADLPAKEVVLPIDGLFLPFPANTIQYGLYKSDQPDLEQPITKIVSKTTVAIIEALSDCEVDEEVLTMLGFYFYCALLTQAKEITDQDFTRICEIEESTITNSNSKITSDFLLERYEENKIDLMQVEESIRNYKLEQLYENPSWLIEWMATCRQVIEKQLSTDEDVDIVMYISNSIKRQLGLTTSMVKLVHYFVKSTLTESQIV